MNKFRKLVLAALTVCVTASASVALAACGNKYANIKNPASNGYVDEEFTGDYCIKVQSSGGLALDGVRVDAVKNGVTMKAGISINGEINLSLEPDVYTLKIDEDTLPAGYYLSDELLNVKTSATNGDVLLPIPSSIISTTANSAYRYSIGDVMYDFSYTTAEGETRLLSDMVAENKVVMLNFFYTTCNPCRTEFPYLQSAYEKYEDVAQVISLATTSRDNATSVAAFKAETGYTFDMALDTQNIGSLFSVEAYPTTVIIDRYGVVCQIHEGSITSASTWTALFKQFSADDYVQNPTQNTDGGDENETTDRVLPTAKVPDNYSSYAAEAANGTGANGKVISYDIEREQADKDYSWPWLVDTIDGETCLATTNANVKNSFATLHVTLSLSAGDVLSYDYNVNTEAGTDILYVYADTERLGMYSGDSDGWVSEYNIYASTRSATIDLIFIYYKSDDDIDAGTDTAAIRNISVVNANTATQPTDIPIEAFDNNSYVNVKLNPEDNYYHIYNESTGEYGQIILANIDKASQWSELHAGGATRYVDSYNVTIPSSLYHFSFYYLSNKSDPLNTDDELIFDYGDFDTLVDNYYLQEFSDNGYTPVTEQLKNQINAFLAAYKNNSDASGGYDANYDENTWLQFCVYYNHYGQPHAHGDSECFMYSDPIKAMTFDNCYEVEEGVMTDVNITKELLYFNGGGLFYKFTAPETGVYFTRSYSDDPVANDSFISIYDSNRNMIKSVDDDLSVTTFRNPDRLNFYAYFYLEKGDYVYLQCRMTTAGGTGEYKFDVNLIGESYAFLRVATTEDGLWTYNEITGFMYYLAIDVALYDDDYYYQVLDDYSQGSKVYIDFINPNYYDQNNHTLYEIIKMGYFGDNTALMTRYYNLSIYGKDADDPLYGKIEADKNLVNIINEFIKVTNKETANTNFWLSLACYFEYYGAD